MDISTNNLINKDLVQVNNINNVKQDSLKNNNDEELKKVANDFESFFLNQIMDVSLRSTKIAGEGAGSDIVKSMYIQSIADKSSGTFGISDMLFDFLSKNNK